MYGMFWWKGSASGDEGVMMGRGSNETGTGEWKSDNLGWERGL